MFVVASTPEVARAWKSPSFTNDTVLPIEEPLLKFINDWLEKQGIESFLQETEPGRYNVVGVLPGKGRGPTLLFNGHMDTALSGSQEDLWITGSTRPEWQALARREDDIISGSGIVNDKGPRTCS